MHAVHKKDSTTNKLRVVFDASAKSDTGTSLNDHLLAGPTVHPSIVNVLLRFRQSKIALTSEVSRMYRAVYVSPTTKRTFIAFCGEKTRKIRYWSIE